MEMRTVVGRVLQRTDLVPADPQRAKAQFRVITLSPKGGVRVRLPAAPRAATPAEPEPEPVT
jgi:cytochrome P450